MLVQWHNFYLKFNALKLFQTFLYSFQLLPTTHSIPLSPCNNFTTPPKKISRTNTFGTFRFVSPLVPFFTVLHSTSICSSKFILSTSVFTLFPSLSFPSLRHPVFFPLSSFFFAFDRFSLQYPVRGSVSFLQFFFSLYHFLFHSLSHIFILHLVINIILLHILRYSVFILKLCDLFLYILTL